MRCDWFKRSPRMQATPDLTDQERERAKDQLPFILPDFVERLTAGLIVGGLGSALIFGLRWVRSLMDPNDLWLSFVIPLAVLLAGYAIAFWMYNSWCRKRRYRRAMAKAGLICKRCAYSFHGLAMTVRRCPECGAGRSVIQ
jgi:hypothetical protein